ncbi:MAG: (d)CMP kinase [Armatimonadia bacterium]|nr:(d)CMP kinase [Armatimonadia bacterium]
MSERAGCMVAIDGPAGAGKSTIARAVAERTGFTYIDTGAMYRAVALHALREGLDVEDEADAIGELAGRLRFEFRQVDDDQRIFVDAEDVERAVRTPEVGNLSSPVSAIPAVREHLVAAQRRMAEREPVVMEGRDIGTVVFPDALLKVFLTASAEERARRRYEQRVGQGEEADYERILADQRARDRRDRTRDVAPLRRADDAVEIDSDRLAVEEVVRRVMELLEDRLEGSDGAV